MRQPETGGDHLVKHRLPARLEPAAEIFVVHEPADHLLHASL
jgi:hypothetical protein